MPQVKCSAHIYFRAGQASKSQLNLDVLMQIGNQSEQVDT